MPVTKTADNSAGIAVAVNALLRSKVVVGIPDSTADRQPAPGETGAPPSNALIGYWMETGVPERNIPARPFLLPGCEAVRNDTAAALVRAGEAALKGDPVAVEQGLERVGLIASAAVKQKIADGPFAPLAQRTIEARAARTARGTKGAKQYLKLQAEGTPVEVLQGANLVKPLIDTGSLLKSVTYAVRNK